MLKLHILHGNIAPFLFIATELQATVPTPYLIIVRTMETWDLAGVKCSLSGIFGNIYHV